MDSWSTLLVLSEVLKGSQRNLVAGKVLDEMCGMLAQPDYCRTRKVGTDYLITWYFFRCCDIALVVDGWVIKSVKETYLRKPSSASFKTDLASEFQENRHFAAFLES